MRRGTMSDTRRDIQPNWGPGNSRWETTMVVIGHGDDPRTDKYRHRDRPPAHMKSPGRFTKGCRNCRLNLAAKNDALRLHEALAD